ncbi:MAG: hypothetical protein QOF38_1944 [Pseudonocardiales bacterium]|nr:hypothetical protein [Pseudonocardiales bacterium]
MAAETTGEYGRVQGLWWSAMVSSRPNSVRERSLATPVWPAQARNSIGNAEVAPSHSLAGMLECVQAALAPARVAQIVRRVVGRRLVFRYAGFRIRRTIVVVERSGR